MADGTLALVERGEELSRASPQCREYYQASGYTAREEGIFLCYSALRVTSDQYHCNRDRGIHFFPWSQVYITNFAQLLVAESRPR